MKYSGHNLYTRKGIKGGNQDACAALCFKDTKCKFWTFNPRSVQSVSFCMNDVNLGLRNVGSKRLTRERPLPPKVLSPVRRLAEPLVLNNNTL